MIKRVNKMKDNKGLNETDLIEQELDEEFDWLYIKKSKKNKVVVKCITQKKRKMK